jgi:hypothetical protein
MEMRHENKEKKRVSSIGYYRMEVVSKRNTKKLGKK